VLRTPVPHQRRTPTIEIATQPSNTRLSGADKIRVEIELFFTAEISKLVVNACHERTGRSAVRLPAVVLRTTKKLSYPPASLVQLRFRGPD